MAERRKHKHTILSSRRGSAFGTFLITLLLVVAIGVFAFSAWKLYGFYKDYKAGTDEYSELNDAVIDTNPQTPPETGTGTAPAPSTVFDSVATLEDPATLPSILEGAYREGTVENGANKDLPKLVNPVDFNELQQINPDVIGWIRVGAVNISYPVTQGEDNEFYLHRTFKKVDNFAGCIFLNAENSPFFTDQNTIVYGHNMKNGSMFGQLKKFSEQETLDKNPYFWIFTKDFIYQYRIFSSSIVNKIGDPYIIRFSEEDFAKFIQKSIASSEINCGDVQVTPQDRVVTLSTCTGDDETRRILQGVLVQVYISA